jgi:hypothetical protein
MMVIGDESRIGVESPRTSLCRGFARRIIAPEEADTLPVEGGDADQLVGIQR